MGEPPRSTHHPHDRCFLSSGISRNLHHVHDQEDRSNGLHKCHHEGRISNGIEIIRGTTEVIDLINDLRDLRHILHAIKRLRIQRVFQPHVQGSGQSIGARI